MSHIDFADFLRKEREADAKFFYITPPFDFNSPDVSQYPPEVTGQHLLNALCRRLGWPSLTGKRLLDFGCGVRFARTIVNLGIDIGLYVGIDTNEQAIDWLKSNIEDARLKFEHLNIKHPIYNPSGAELLGIDIAESIDQSEFDAACMFSVITHQTPQDAETIFGALYRCISERGSLYFTAFVDETVDRYVERDPTNPTLLSTYHPDLLLDLLSRTRWTVQDIYGPSQLQQTAFVCGK